MNTQNESQYVMPVMAHFSCDKTMAELIIKSYKANNDFESIERLCKDERGTKHNGKR